MRFQQAYSSATSPRIAVHEIAVQMDSAPDAVLFFCSSDYPLSELAKALSKAFKCPVAGCTCASSLSGPGFHATGISALGFFGGGVSMSPLLIAPLSAAIEQTLEVSRRVPTSATAGHHRFGVLLIDGLSKSEESVASTLYQTLGDLPFIGFSASDDLLMRETFVYHDGNFVSNAAVFCIFETTSPVHIFKFQHFVPTSQRILITDADPEHRVIREIDGLPAAEGYADAVGVSVHQLNFDVFTQHPLLLSLEDDSFVRSIASINKQGGFNCFSRVDTGSVLSIGRAVDPLIAIETAFANVATQIGAPQIVLGSDCVMRRLEFQHKGMLDEVGRRLGTHRVFGMSTYGEQINAQHVNQTFTGVAIGA